MRLNTFVTFLLLTLLNSIHSQKCGLESNYSCLYNQTCCKSTNQNGNLNYSCFPGRDSVCCDKISAACPNGSKCDLENSKCIPETKLFKFLSSPNEFNNQLSEFPVVEKIVNLKFLRGFLIGTKVFGELKECAYPEKVIKMLDKMYFSVINLFDRKEVFPSAVEILVVYKELLDYSENLVKICSEDADNLRKGFRDLNRYFSHSDYPQRLLDHTISELVNIGKIVETYKVEFKELSSFDNGKNLGNIVRFILFSDFDRIN
jgi:hypothetical protein